jgi:hypothetical protein
MDLVDSSQKRLWTIALDKIILDFPEQVLSHIIFDYLSSVDFEFATDIPEKTYFHWGQNPKTLIELREYIKVTKDSVKIIQYSAPWICVFSKYSLCQQQSRFALIVDHGVYYDGTPSNEFRIGVGQLQSKDTFYYVRNCASEMSKVLLWSCHQSICMIEFDLQKSMLLYTFATHNNKYHQHQHKFAPGYLMDKHFCVGVGYKNQSVRIVPVTSSCIPSSLLLAHLDPNIESTVYNRINPGDYGSCGQPHDV